MIDAVVLSTSPLDHDGRVRRHVRILATAGLKVTTITGVAEAAGKPGGAEVDTDNRITVRLEPYTFMRKALTAACFFAGRAMPGEGTALALARAIPGVGAVADRLLEVLESLPSGEAPLVLANDWTSLPAAILAHDRYGCRIHYDTHEFAVAELDSSVLWRLIFPHLIRRIERAGIIRAASVSCVSPGIAREMASLYGLAQPPVVLRNVPDDAPMPPKPVGDRIDVLYHGLFTADRGVLALIESLKRWPARYRLILRGRAPNTAFGAMIAKAAEAPGLKDRIVIEPMVAADAVVRMANRADIGIFLPDLASRQNRHALPNKLFEYLAAGLMAIVPSGTDMAALITEHGAGLALNTTGPDELATALAELTPARLSAYKMNAHRAAQTLTFSAEAQKLRQALGIG